MTRASGLGPPARLTSVNVGGPRTVGWAGRLVRTSIWKVPASGRVAVAGVNLTGDEQSDLRVHGGPDKAVYAYATEDYKWWEGQLGADLAPGTFGENLTVAGVDLAEAVVGETWEVGTARMAVTQPRMPCFKLGIRMGDADFVDRFDEAGRLGTYLRIVQAGEVGAGDEIRVVSVPAHGLKALFIAQVQKSRDAEGLEALFRASDVPEQWRAWAARQLGRADPAS